MTYYLLASRHGTSWAPQFGDHDLQTVQCEQHEWTRDLPRAERKGATRIVRFPRVPTQRQTLAKLAELS